MTRRRTEHPAGCRLMALSLRNVTKRHITYLACTTVLVGALAGTAPASAAHRIHVVHPGESIQKAVNAARPGDTVFVLAGTYRESVTVKTPGLTLRGEGDRTVIKPVKKKKTKSAPPAAKATVSCEEGGNGVCVIGAKNTALERVTVADLKVTGFSRMGVWSMGTDRLTVQRVTADDNGQWGIAQEHSTRGLFRDNIARRNGDAGLFLANNVKAEEGARDTKGTLVVRNRLEATGSASPYAGCATSP